MLCMHGMHHFLTVEYLFDVAHFLLNLPRCLLGGAASFERLIVGGATGHFLNFARSLFGGSFCFIPNAAFHKCDISFQQGSTLCAEI